MRCFLLCGLVAAWTAPTLVAQGPAKRHEVVTPRYDGINATAINARGDLIGSEWLEDPQTPGVIGQEPFFARGGRMIRIPLLPTYTSTFPAGVSDTGLVVGRSSKPGSTRGRVPLQNQAFIWTEADGIRGIGALPDDFSSIATGVTRDGWTICGVTIGENRIRACVWERAGSGSGVGWRGIPLPQTAPIASNFLAISDDGRFVAGLDGSTPTLWARPPTSREAWTREPIGPSGSINPRAVNNAGTVAGVILPRDGSTHAAVWTRATGVQPIPEPAGYTRSEAAAINNAGVVVGMIDGPAGSPVAPHAFVFEDDQLRILDEGGPSFAAATALNDAGQVSGVFEKEENPEPAPPDKPVVPNP